MSDTAQFAYDVFISYSSRDKDWVRGELLRGIEQTGLKAFIDFRDFTPGAPSLKEMERGVLESRKTLLVLTPAFIDSEWTESESLMLQALGPANRDLRLIPLLTKECKKPLRIEMLTHIDFTGGADIDLAWRQLLTALGKAPEQEPPKRPERGDWLLAHPYPMPPNFTGRHGERAVLSRWLTQDTRHPLLLLQALGGFGKSSLVWHWLMHDVAPATWPRVVWWSLYEGDASFDKFVVRAFQYVGRTGSKVTASKNTVGELLRVLRKPGTLLVLDGFERALRAFGGLDAAYRGDHEQSDAGTGMDGRQRDCISPLAEDFLRSLAVLPDIESKILITTRLRPRVLEAKGGGLLRGCSEEELRQLQPADAVAFFLAQGIRGTRVEIEAACHPYGYHPLSLRLLAGLIVQDFQQPGDITIAHRLDVGPDQVQRQHHVLETAYNTLTRDRQHLLGLMSCFRSPVPYDTLQRLAETEDQERRSRLDLGLRDLISRGLVHHDAKERRFDLHPIVRRYAYDRLTAGDRGAAHARLRDYFSAVPTPESVTRLEDLTPVIELYHHTVRGGGYDAALRLFVERINRPTYFQLAAYSLQIDLLRALFPDGENHPPRLKDELSRGWTLNALGNSYAHIGQPRRAIPLLTSSITSAGRLGDKRNQAIALSTLAEAQVATGEFRAAESSLLRSIAVGEHDASEAIARQGLGHLLACRGDCAASEKELARAQALFDAMGIANTSYISTVRAFRSKCELLRQRLLDQRTLNPQTALEWAGDALERAEEIARARHPFERDYVRAHWLLGASYRIRGTFDEAEFHLNSALERSRRINLVDFESDIIIDLVRLRAATGSAEEAQRLAEEALLIAERGEYVLQGADAHLELAKLALARQDSTTALEHAAEARRLAECDGPPDYTYKAAYDEAGALLDQLGVA